MSENGFEDIMRDAIIAVNEDHNGFMVKMLSKDPEKLKIHNRYDSIPEIEFDVPPGLYYATMFLSLGDDECDVDWGLDEPIMVVEGLKESPLIPKKGEAMCATTA